MLAKTSLLDSSLSSGRRFVALLATLVCVSSACGVVDTRGLGPVDGGPAAQGGQAGALAGRGARGGGGTRGGGAGRGGAGSASGGAEGGCCGGRGEPVTGASGVRQCTSLCVADGVACATALDCCSLGCNGGVCGATLCKVESESCSANADCCSNICQ